MPKHKEYIDFSNKTVFSEEIIGATPCIVHLNGLETDGTIVAGMYESLHNVPKVHTTFSKDGFVYHNGKNLGHDMRPRTARYIEQMPESEGVFFVKVGDQYYSPEK